MDGFLEKTLDNKEQSVSHDELMIRRLKNRERQRRYRARKRLQVDTKKAPDHDYSNQDTLQHVQSPVAMTSEVSGFSAKQCSPVLLEVPVAVKEHYGIMPFAQEFPRPVNGTFQEPVTRVYCARDWKKDARKARALKHQEVPESTSSNNGSQTPLPLSNKAGIVQSDGIAVDVSAQVNSEAPRFVPSRRQWKAEARNKKS